MHKKTPGFQMICISVLVCIGLSISTYSRQHFSNTDFGIALSESTGTPSIEPVQDSVYAIAEIMPQFPGGKAAQDKFLAEHIKYPVIAQENRTQGRVIVQFIVSKTGKIEHANVVKKVSPELDREALRIVSSYPTWIPGEHNGLKVSVYQLVPITFKISYDDNEENHTNTKQWQVTDSTLIVLDSLKMPLKFNLEVINTEEIDTGVILKPFPIKNKIKLINQYGPLAANGVIHLKTYSTKDFFNDGNKYKPGDEKFIFKLADKMPQYPGGDSGLMNYICHSLKYPAIAMEEGIEGKVIIRFVVDKTGRVRNPRLVNSVDPTLDQEALRVIRSLQDWIPGEMNGKRVNVYYTLPIGFKLEGGSSHSKGFPNSDLNQNILVILDGEKLPIGFDINWLNFSKLKTYNISRPINKTQKQKLIERYGEDAKNGVVVIQSNANNPNISNQLKSNDSSGNPIYQTVDVMPKFPGGNDKMMGMIFNNIKNPEFDHENGLQLKINIRFVVTSTGEVESPELIQSSNTWLDKEALRAVSKLPDFIPGELNGNKVSVYYTLPIAVRSVGN